MDVYADLLFLIDFFMDFACLKIASKIGSFEGKTYRICIASAIGGAYSVAALFVPDGVLSAVLSMVFCIIISAAAFFRKGDKILRILKISLVYLGVNTAMGGGVSAAFYLIQRFFDSADENSELLYTESLSPEIYISLALGCLLAYFTVTAIKKANVDKAERIRIKAFGETLELELLVDSGNRLRDPLHNKACTVISQSDLAKMIGEEKAELFSNGRFECFGDIKACAVPTMTVNGSSLMFGFLPCGAELIDSDGKTLKTADTVIAVSNEKSFESGKAIFPAELI